MSNARLLVVSCPRRKPIQAIWKLCQQQHWPDCPFPIDMLSPEQDIGWNANLIQYLNTISESFVLLMLDDHFVDKALPGGYTANMQALLDLMTSRSDIGMVKLQAGNAASPEIPFEPWPRLREYDRAHHPFKRTNLVPTMFRRDWLLRLSTAVLKQCGPASDKGRKGALEFEVAGTLLTEDSIAWPERMLGIHRPNADGGGGQSLLQCIASDGVREGKMQTTEELRRLGIDVKRITGIEAFL